VIVPRSRVFDVEGGRLMTNSRGEKTDHEQSGVSVWRRVLLAIGNVGFFLLSGVVILRLRSLAGEEIPWWLWFVIFLVPLVAMDVLLQMVLLRPMPRSPHESSAQPDRPRE
jgi:hypothetical protein